MEIFSLTVSQMLLMFTLMATGFILRKKLVISEESGTIMAKLETFVFVPALILFNMITRCNVKTFTANSSLILYGAVITFITIIVAYPLSALFVRKANESSEKLYLRSIYKYAITFTNSGYMGNFIILGVWGNDMLYKYSLLLFVYDIFCKSYGLYLLVPKDKNDGLVKNLKKGLLQPPIIAMVIGIAAGLLGLGKFIPSFIVSALESAGNCQGPVAMLLAGFIIGGFEFKKLLTNKKVYAVTFLRMILMPSVIMFILMLIGTSKEIMTLILIATATPLGLNTIVFPAAYGGDTKTGASMTMISHTLSIITIPLMYLIFIVLL